MGGRGPGHKSDRARAARLRNIQRARAARKRPPLPWRSGLESRVIEQLVWQWWIDPGPRKWPAYRVARFLDVSHTWIAKLVKRFRADPDRVRRRMRAFAPADFEKLQRARQETQWQRERGRLRGPIRWRRAKHSLQGKQRTVLLETKSEARRRDARSAKSADALGPRFPKNRAAISPRTFTSLDLPPWAVGIVAPAAIAGSAVSPANSLASSSAARQPASPNTVSLHPIPPLDIDRPPKSLEQKRKGPIPFAFRRPRR